MAGYREFIDGKHVRQEPSGIKSDPCELNGRLFDWQRETVSWMLQQGKAALFADCGLGKSFMQLEWASQLHRRDARQVLILCPIAVADQTLREAGKFGIDAPIRIVAEQSECDEGINLTNYEKLHKFDAGEFDAVVLDESSILKSYTGSIKRRLLESFRHTKYRLACTATPAPNDLMELGNHSEFLSVMPSNEMLARWFINDGKSVGKYRLKNHGAKDYWQWVSSWAMAMSKPSDVGDYDDARYALPELKIKDVLVDADLPTLPGGQLTLCHPGHEVSATTVHQEKRASLEPKADRIAELVDNGELWVCWVDTDYEADAITKRVPDAVEVRGSMPESLKRERLTAFSDGKIRVLVTKPKIGGFGMNWQHCHNMTYMAGFSFESWYQSVRRMWRFGQTEQVNVYILMSVAEESVKRSLDRKMKQHREIGAELCRSIRESRITGPSVYNANQAMEVPSWLKTSAV